MSQSAAPSPPPTPASGYVDPNADDMQPSSKLSPYSSRANKQVQQPTTLQRTWDRLLASWLAQLAIAAMVVCVVMFTTYYHRAEWQKAYLFYVHPLCMTLGMGVAIGEGILAWRLLLLSQNATKAVHATMMTLGVGALATGAAAVVLYTPMPFQFLTVHSWFGACTLLLVLLQYSGGLAAFTAGPCLERSPASLSAYIPSHATLGLFVLISGVISIATGVTTVTEIAQTEHLMGYTSSEAFVTKFIAASAYAMLLSVLYVAMPRRAPAALQFPPTSIAAAQHFDGLHAYLPSNMATATTTTLHKGESAGIGPQQTPSTSLGRYKQRGYKSRPEDEQYLPAALSATARSTTSQYGSGATPYDTPTYAPRRMATRGVAEPCNIHQ